MSSLTPRIDSIEKALFNNEIEVAKIDAPFTEIVDESGQPRQISDLANNMKTSMGVERITTTSITGISNEFGPNGEQVYEAQNKDPRIRFVGNWDSVVNQFGGTHPTIDTTETNGFAEITFYGTGLNILMSSAAGAIDGRAIVDGGADFNFKSGISNVLSNRNYKHNIIFPVTSGLSLGIHTVKIYKTDTVGGFSVDGVEILNETSQVTVNPGKPKIDSNNRELQSQILSSYNSDFDVESDVLGNKGGRVLVYQDIDGNINKRLKATDPQVTPGDPTELVTNGTFDTDLTGWVTDAGATWDAGRLRRGTVAGDRYIKQAVSVTPGQDYVFNIDVDFAGASFASINIYDGANEAPDETITGALITGQTINADATVSLSFTAISGDVSIYLNNGNAGVVYFDNASLKETSYNFLALENTSHSNEEIIRTINWREFGANRSDDFSTLAAFSNRAFTLDDGTTTLVGFDVNVASGAISGQPVLHTDDGVGNFYTITFIGTGLDLLRENQDANSRDDQVIIDGVDVGNITLAANQIKRQKICSGLPYGTHTVKIENNSGVLNGGHVKDFIIYGPKKPELSSTDIELADYNIMADYILNPNNGLSIDNIGTGMVRKHATREFTYSGSFSLNAVQPNEYLGGFEAFTTTNGDYIEYTFFGTGFEYRARAGNNRTASIQCTIDGQTDLSGFTTAAYGDGVSITPATGILDIFNASTNDGNRAGGISITGLSLGLHTVRFAKNTADGLNLVISSLDIVTPIHINDNSLKVGSLSLKDSRVTVGANNEENKNNIDLGKAKAWIHFEQSTQIILSSYNISAVLDSASSSGVQHIYFKYPFKDTNYVATFGGESQNTSLRNIITGAGITSGISNGNKTKNRYTTQMFDHDGTNRDGILSIVWFGELENEEDLDLGDL